MADPDREPIEDEDIVLSFFPDPPPFYKHFTSDNLARLQAVEKESTAEDDESKSGTATKLSAEQILALPTELRYLIPPEPPADDAEFHVFNTIAKAKGTDAFANNMEFISKQLEEQGILSDWTYEQLYPSADELTSSTSQPQVLDRQNYLFRFLRSILLSYISLLGIAAVNPASEQKDGKLRDIMTLVANMHALINEYRPHQARQTLIERMEEQVRRKREEVERVKMVGDKVREVLQGFGQMDVGDEDRKENEQDLVGRDEDVRGAQKSMWAAMAQSLE